MRKVLSTSLANTNNVNLVSRHSIYWGGGGNLKEPKTLVNKSRLMPVLWTITSSKGTLNLELHSVVCTVPCNG